METPAPFSLDTALQHWRTHISQVPGISRDRLDELESHLRDSLDRLRAAGLADDEAWMIAEKRLGRNDVLATEFTRMDNLVTDGQPASRESRNRSMIAIGAGFALTALVLHMLQRYGVRGPMEWPPILLGALLGGWVTGAIANRFPIRHGFRAGLLLTALVISLSLIHTSPFVFPWDASYDRMDVSVFGELWHCIWPALVIGATMCIGAAVVQGQRSSTLRRYSRKFVRVIRDRWSLSGGTAGIQH
jgi:hypothetical protein